MSKNRFETNPPPTDLAYLGVYQTVLSALA